MLRALCPILGPMSCGPGHSRSRTMDRPSVSSLLVRAQWHEAWGTNRRTAAVCFAFVGLFVVAMGLSPAAQLRALHIRSSWTVVGHTTTPGVHAPRWRVARTSSRLPRAAASAAATPGHALQELQDGTLVRLSAAVRSLKSITLLSLGSLGVAAVAVLYRLLSLAKTQSKDTQPLVWAVASASEERPALSGVQGEPKWKQVLRNRGTALHTPERTLEVARAEYAAIHGKAIRDSEAQFAFVHEAGALRRDSNAEGTWECFSFANAVHTTTVVDAVPPAPFLSSDLARTSRQPLFTRDECAAVIAEAEDPPLWRGANRLASFAKRAASFRPVRELPQTKAWLDSRIPMLFEAIACAFPTFDPHHLRVSAASVLKYDACVGQTELGAHRDGPGVACVVSLNDAGEYDGGGTYIEALGKALRVDAGHAVLHPGNVRHAGAQITRGVRYILVIWAYSASFPAPEHYAVCRASEHLAAALNTAPGGFRDELLVGAAFAFDEALRLGAGTRTEAAHLGLGQALLALGYPGLASGFFDNALLRSPQNALAAELQTKAMTAGSP